MVLPLKPNHPPPSIGRIVHFHPPDRPVVLAAIITGIVIPEFGQVLRPWTVNLAVFEDVRNTPESPRVGPADIARVRDVPFSEEPMVGTWSWPPRV